MTENSPTLEEWRRLYEAATRVRELASWEWMEETDVFGVQNPETNELGFISVMGMLGEHYAVALYLGARGLYGFLAFEDARSSLPPEQILEVPQLQVSFESRDMLSAQDREIIKKLGVKFRGANAWPKFRSYRPGFFPWYLEAEEARFLTYGLEQVLDVAPRFEEDLSLLQPPGEQSYLVRVPRQCEGVWAWEDRIMEVPSPEPPRISLAMDAQSLEKVKQLRRVKNRIEIDLFLLPAPVGEKGSRPVFPYVLMSVETQSGFVLGSEILAPEPSLEAMWGQIPQHVIKQLEIFGVLPEQIAVRLPLLLQLLQPLAKELGLKLKQSRTMRSLDAAKESMLGFMMQQ